MQQLQHLAAQNRVEKAHTGHVAAWSVKARDMAFADGIAPVSEDDRNCRGGGLGGQDRITASRRRDHRDLAFDQFSGKLGEPIVLVVGVTVFDGDVAAFSKPCLI